MNEQDDKFAAFGRAIFEAVTENVAQGYIGEQEHEILEIAERHGLAKQVKYDPKKHGPITDVEPGDTCWVWGSNLGSQ